MTRPARWAFSSLDNVAHLLADGDHPGGVLTARCGHPLPMAAVELAPPPDRKCPRCEVILFVDASAPGRFSRQVK